MKKLFLILISTIAFGHLQAREIYLLNDNWLFSFRHENSSDNARCITLPHTWNLDALTGKPDYLRTTADYTRKLYVPRAWTGKRLFLKFYGVENTAEVFVNGKYIGGHRGGSTAFAFEITEAVKFGTENDLRVAVRNVVTGDVLPLSSIHNIYGGIYRDVELIVTDQTAISPLYMGSNGILIHPLSITPERVDAEAEIHLLSPVGSACRLTLELFAPSGLQVVSKSARIKPDGKPIIFSFSIEEPWLWSLSNPNLYQVQVTVENDNSHDQTVFTTGFRNISVSPQQGFLLNDSLVRIQGVSLYYDRSGSGNVITKEEYQEDFALLRELGANALRSPAGPHADELYDLCDRNGILVWIDLPLIQAPFLSDISYYPSPQLEENGKQQLKEIIIQNQNRPSVVMWGIFTRLWTRGENPTAYVRTLNEQAHKLDPTRPTVACSDQDGDLNFITDLIVWGQDLGWERGQTSDLAVWLGQLKTKWSHLRSAICYGEPGRVDQQAENGRQRRPGSGISHPESEQTRFHEDYAKYLAQDSVLWGVWINTLADYGSARRADGIEATGLVSLDREKRKDAFYLYKTLWNKNEPTLYIADRHNNRRSSELQTLTVYSSAGMPIVTKNCDTLRVKEYAPGIYRCDSIEMRGCVKITAEAGGLRDSVLLNGDFALTAPQQRGLPQTVNLRRIN